MLDCEYLNECPFFNDEMEKIPKTSAVLKKKYCGDEFYACARFIIAKKLGKEKVPGDLFPHQKDRVSELIMYASAAKR